MKIKADNDQLEFIPETAHDIFDLGRISAKAKEGFEARFIGDELSYVRLFTDDILTMVIEGSKKI